MSTAYAPHGHVHRPHLSGSHKAWWTWISAVVAAGLLVTVAAWAVAQRVGDEDVAALETAALPDLQWVASMRAADVGQLEGALRAAGYAIQVDGVLDPVTKSAAADFLRAADQQRLEAWIAGALARTVITGRRDPVAWNARFGDNRSTSMVERPLTGPQGQLDDDGNIRSSS